MNDLITKVIAWANERNIIQGSSAIRQLDKTSEEFNELQRAVALHLRDPGSEGAFDEVGDANEDRDDARLHVLAQRHPTDSTAQGASERHLYLVAEEPVPDCLHHSAAPE